ncbi:DEAD/DEAH box helicase [Bradyrhizobium sp. 186]|uniref:DEAD/DEAH box helicase n=1 Tax=Bradyrhizobium sp. 186 TaxID=2782654 RepID=UPI002000BABF|nr:DEAD/DEAH box helicase [Bradyrhizobium sp. 186]UPK39531.1 DEAD/DEAH box helicase [Bradyrhizobium sp. 186]
MNELIPIENAWVCRGNNPAEIGFVKRVFATGDEPSIEVDFGPKGVARLKVGEWGCGLRAGFTVQDVPLSGVRETLGTGTVMKTRELATRHQALVQFHSTGQSLWLPFERLRRVMDPALRFRRSEPATNDSAERLALNVIAHLLKSWNEATGALDRLDVDPLPHQIGLVHRILNSGQTNWLIADDVGLGKTIEIGLLLAALERRQNIRRILVVVPSGLTRQWKEEMLIKFDRRFLIYGIDFRVSDPREWGLYERVIVSLDLAKPRNAQDDGCDMDSTFGMFMAAGAWDIIIFDEAHRLSRDEQGRSTLRFRLAQGLRERTDALVLLTGTPHQGDQGKFRNLLTLVRPDLGALIKNIDQTPDVVREIILRNRKIDAVDIDGNFLFHGLLVRRVEVETDEQFTILEARLRQYLSRGYGAGDSIGGKEGRAVGFVMTIYRKLASSSVAALWIALRRRLDRLSLQPSAPDENQEAFDEDDQPETDDNLGQHGPLEKRQPFFEGEELMLRDLIARGEACMRTDKKGAALVKIVREVVQDQGQKLLIFTEFRSTQAYLLHQVEKLLGARPVIIHGGMTVDEKREAVRSFEGDIPVLISTEAGGEGLNLHRRCHILVNFDLPWNPARLTQRMGRLYRYGQKERVVVINFHARDTIDNEIVSTVIDRVDTIVREMKSVGPEFDELYAAEVMGELLERVDISELLDEARNGHVERTKERIDAAVAEATKAKRLQDEILNQVDRPDVSGSQLLGGYTTANVASFVQRASVRFGIEVEASSNLENFTLRLPPELRGTFHEFGNRTVIVATTRRRGWNPAGEVALIDFSGTFLKYLVTSVTAADFSGSYATFAEEANFPKFFAVFLARFQDDQGHHQGENLIVVQQEEDSIEVDGKFLSRLFDGPLRDADPIKRDPTTKKAELDAARDRAELAMAKDVTQFRHPNDLVTLAVAELGSPAP